jgi:ElaB/YqjD/DUF883 family membrane-anchored ribosome-binding protein
VTTDPDQLRREIEGTQQNLGADVDALAEKVTPGRIVQRRVGKARGMARDMRDRVMGSASSGSDAAGDTMRSVADSASSAAGTVTDTVQEAPERIRRGTEGNPLAAGLIAFGAGWLVSSLVPASRQEQRLAGQVKESVQDAAGPVTEQLGSAAQEIKENLREPAQQAVESVRSTASDAASTVTDETKSTAKDVRGSAEEAKGTVQQHAR